MDSSVSDVTAVWSYVGEPADSAEALRQRPRPVHALANAGHHRLRTAQRRDRNAVVLFDIFHKLTIQVDQFAKLVLTFGRQKQQSP